MGKPNTNKSRRKGYREYSRIKNFAQHRCTKVEVTFASLWGTTDCPNEYREGNIHLDLDSWVEAKYTRTENGIYYFEYDQDAVVFTLKYPCK